jgi:hypothetical protein
MRRRDGKQIVNRRGKRVGNAERRKGMFSRAAGAHQADAAVPIRSNLLRLEHELQTAVDGSAGAAVMTLGAGGALDAPPLRPSQAARAPDGKL